MNRYFVTITIRTDVNKNTQLYTFTETIDATTYHQAYNKIVHKAISQYNINIEHSVVNFFAAKEN